MFYAVTSMWSMVCFVGSIHFSVDLCDSRSSNHPWKVTIPGFLLRGRIVWGWILEIQWSLSSWNKLGSLQHQLQVWFKLVVDHGDKGKRKNLQCSICPEISMLRALARDWRVENCFCGVVYFPQDHFMKLAKSPIFCITEIQVRGLDINTNSIKRQATSWC